MIMFTHPLVTLALTDFFVESAYKNIDSPNPGVFTRIGNPFTDSAFRTNGIGRQIGNEHAREGGGLAYNSFELGVWHEHSRPPI
jgi:hypothetical protein